MRDPEKDRTIRIREATASDFLFLEEMLYNAILWNNPDNPPSKEELLSEPVIAALLNDWPNRKGDYALIAEDTAGMPLGAVWYRFGTKEFPGFAYIDTETPELGVAVIRSERGRGIGTDLMRGIMLEAARRGIHHISLSVDPKNPALHLYKKLGFRKVGQFETSWTMLASLKQGASTATDRPCKKDNRDS